ncbi:ATP-binding protein [Aspergillus aculeatinus CBS 121060]|uniref:P-loop containing nucleoside triphosphate hydrolase protein n=1 Tax=Aspergillus aculeatinus CBS 121060 TaxID=1448322 RepID=A0ACD1HAG9_9EURO|nr:P-loop containing nucleoside triphosphate hydrolase protein [Aspergillus aculeatinus CBS 121060]RAH70577.1 P-loop containing nucleoside triphosphate hydrolase protein [Aspergillus aculeatinus CBS 121060]
MDHELAPLKALEMGSVKRIYYSDLWHIFKPGQVVITRQEPLHAYRVLYVTAGRPYLSPPALENDDSGDGYKVPAKESDLLIHCYQIQFDGQRFGPVTHTFNIQPYSGRLRVKNLPIYPLKFVEDPKVLKETLVSSGRKFLRVSKGTHLQYRGPNLHEGEEIDSEVIVDFQTAIWDDRDKDPGWNYRVEFGVNPPKGSNRAEVTLVSAGGCLRVDCCENDRVYDDLDIDHRRMEDFIAKNRLLTTDTRYLDDNPENVPEEDLILFPNRVFAFVLKDRKWAVIDLNHVDLDAGADQPRDRGWNSLVLPPGHKQMVHSLVQAHFRHRREEALDRNSQADLIRGKGKGLIILLHGAPGVGKTSTAECVAELCNLPLYPITCGDLGITATDVESRLKYIFTQAQKWKCVLLLDEADVFLSQRENNVKHNSLVSVFLRVLEYYQGILFLTTNRVGKIDEAFRSRVHISLYYPPLDKRSTQKIFAENMSLAEKRGKSVIRVNRDEIRDFAREHYRNNDPQRRWNGRQIRNAFHIAIAIAEDRAAEKDAKAAAEGKERRHTPVLKAEYLRLVEAASTRFDDYLHTVHGMGQQDLAKQGSTRRDDWEEDRDRRDNRKYQSSRAADPRRRKVNEYSETSMTESSEAETHKHTSSEQDSDDGSERGRKEEEEPSSSDEEPSLRESRKRSDRKKGSQTKERKHGPGETRKDSTRSSRKNKDSR